jgi:hypothetical protein
MHHACKVIRSDLLNFVFLAFVVSDGIVSKFVNVSITIVHSLSKSLIVHSFSKCLISY